MLAIFYTAIFVGLPSLWLWNSHMDLFGFNWIQASLALFCMINAMICMWEWTLFFYRRRIKMEFEGFKKKLPAASMPSPIFLFQKVSLSDALSLKYWSLVWSTYSLLDPSYSDQTTFGFFVDVGNGFTTFIPTLLFAWAMTFAHSHARVLGTVCIIKFYQELYGTVIYFFSYLLNGRYKGHSLTNQLVVAIANGIWIVFPALGMYASWTMIESDSYNVFRVSVLCHEHVVIAKNNAALLRTQTASLTVVAQATVNAEPNVAYLIVGVHAQDKKASEARKEAAKAAQHLLKTLDKIPSINSTADIATISFSIFPVYSQPPMMNPEPREPKIIGYKVEHQFRVVVHDLDDVGLVIDKSVGAIEDNVQVSSISFGIKNEVTLQDKARTEAVENAFKQAKVLASAAGMSVGQVLEITEDLSSHPMPMPKFAMPVADGSSTPIMGGSISISTSIKVIFSLV